MRFILLLLLLGLAASRASAGGVKGAKGLRSERRVLKDNEENPDDNQGVDIAEIIGFGCFAEDSTVQVLHQDTPVRMMDLRVGDQVLTTDNEYAPVYTFGHRLPNQKDVFVQLETAQGKLQMTGEHLVFLMDKSIPVRADSIQPGHVLRGQQQNTGTKVFATSIVVREGLYAPFTTKGTIVVDGIAASSYISLQNHESEMVQLNGWDIISQHSFVHLSLSPLRMACLGISSSFCQQQTNDQVHGMPGYIAGGLALQRFAEQQPMYIQVLILATWMTVMAVCLTLETIFGASEAPSALVVLTLLYFVLRAMRIHVRCKLSFPNGN